MPRTRPVKANALPLFAHSLEAQKLIRMSPTERIFWSGAALSVLSIGACAILLMAARPDRAQSRPGSAAPTKAAAPQDARSGPAVEPSGDTTTERRPVDFYAKNIDSNLFTAPQPPPPPPPKPVKVEPPKPAPIVPVIPINPFADWAYTGTVHMGDMTMALLENTKTKEGQYLKVGEQFLGAQVSLITDQQVSLSSGGKPYMLAKSDNMTLTPLDKSAAYLTAQPAPAPGQPGAMPPGGAPGMAPGGDMVTLPNGRTLTPDQAARRARRMNRMFNGGGGGGGFQFNRGGGSNQ
jgi:hypothetical protein